MEDVIRIGAHALTLEGDVAHLKLNGALSPKESIDFHHHAADILAARGRLFILLDYRQGTYIGPATRRCVAEWNQTHKVSAVAVYGVNPVTRAVATLLAAISKDVL